MEIELENNFLTRISKSELQILISNFDPRGKPRFLSKTGFCLRRGQNTPFSTLSGPPEGVGVRKGSKRGGFRTPSETPLALTGSHNRPPWWSWGVGGYPPPPSKTPKRPFSDPENGPFGGPKWSFRTSKGSICLLGQRVPEGI